MTLHNIMSTGCEKHMQTPILDLAHIYNTTLPNKRRLPGERDDAECDAYP